MSNSMFPGHDYVTLETKNPVPYSILDSVLIILLTCKAIDFFTANFNDYKQAQGNAYHDVFSMDVGIKSIHPATDSSEI